MKAWGRAPAPHLPLPSGWRESSLATLDAYEQQLDQAEHEARTFQQELAKHSGEQRLTIVRNTRRFHTWAFCRALQAASVAPEPQDLTARLGTAELALEIALSAWLDAPSPQLRTDLQSRSWQCLGHARRLLRDFEGAEEALDQAHRCLKLGTGDPLEEAQLLQIRGTLRTQLHSFSAAHHDYQRARGIYRRLGDAHAEQTCHLSLLELELDLAWSRRYSDPSAELKNLDNIAARLQNLAPLPDLVDLWTTATVRAQDYRANFLRILGRLDEAQVAFDATASYFAHGHLDVLAQARHLNLRSTLDSFRCNFSLAEERLDQSIAMFRDSTDFDSLAWALVDRANLDLELERYDSAAAFYERASRTAPNHKHVQLASGHGRVHALAYANHATAAQRLFLELQPLYAELNEPTTLMKQAWLRGIVDRHLGLHDSALSAFHKARADAVRLSLPYDVALLDLDMAQTHLAAGDLAAACRAATLPLRFAVENNLNPSVQEALQILATAAAAGRMTLTLLATTATFLRRQQRDKSLKFHAAS